MKGSEVDTLQLARLLDGMQALDEGRLGVARYRFRQIVDAAGKQPSLEVGHAWRGLAETSVRLGDVPGAEAELKSAVTSYREVARVDPTARVRAGEGEGAALLLGAELLLRRGLTEAGRQVLVRTAAVLSRLGDDRSAEAWACTGRLAMHLRRPDRARDAFQEALQRYERAGNVAGHAEVLLEAAAMERDAGDLAAASKMLDLAANMSFNAGRLATAARAHLGRARIASNPGSAEDAWLESLKLAISAGDIVIAGFALLGLGATGWKDGEQPLLAGSQLLLDGGHFPGLGLGMLRVAEWAIEHDESEIALAACEGAWRVYRGFDRVAGLGRVLRVVVKAFAAQRRPRATLLAAHARAALVGKEVHHAIQVRDHYASHAPRALTMRLGMMPADELLDETRRSLQRRIVPALREHGLLAQSFATAQGALDVLGVMIGVSPRGAVRMLMPEADTEVPEFIPEAELPELEDLNFGQRTTLKLNLTTASGTSRVDLDRSPVYDPDGRLAALASTSLVFLEEEAEVDEDLEATDGRLPAELFPDDAGVSDWMAPAEEAMAWNEGEDLFGTGPSDPESPSVSVWFEDDLGEEDLPTEEQENRAVLRQALADAAFPSRRTEPPLGADGVDPTLESSFRSLTDPAGDDDA